VLVGLSSDWGSCCASLDNCVVWTERLGADWRRGDQGSPITRLSVEVRREGDSFCV